MAKDKRSHKDSMRTYRATPVGKALTAKKTMVDEANLYTYSRFPGADAQERGARANIGVTYTREDFDGWSLGLTVGRVIRDTDLGQFSISSGLQGKSSEWLVAAQFKLGERLDIINRAIFEDDFTFSRNEMRLN